MVPIFLTRKIAICRCGSGKCKSIEEKTLNEQTAIKLERQMRDYIYSKVKSKFQNLDIFVNEPDAINSNIDDIFEIAYSFLEDNDV